MKREELTWRSFSSLYAERQIGKSEGISPRKNRKSLGLVKELLNNSAGKDEFYEPVLPHFKFNEQVIVWGKQKSSGSYMPYLGKVKNFSNSCFEVMLSCNSKTMKKEIPSELIAKIMPSRVWVELLLNNHGIDALNQYMQDQLVVVPLIDNETDKEILYPGYINEIVYNDKQQLEWRVSVSALNNEVYSIPSSEIMVVKNICEL